MFIVTVQAISAELIDVFPAQETLEVLRGQLPSLGTVLGQMVEDPDILGQMRDAFTNFIESGQVWAMLIGLFLGYMFRSFTSY
ncbi:MAG: hypothetical protein AB4426_00540 [Xenococcaceae cyanobacterium]